MTLRRFLIVVSFLLLTATVANAYTLVMRNGRRVEIPDDFTVTASTLTYTVGSGIQITLQLSGINIPATERANQQAPGSFLAKVVAPVSAPAVPQATQVRAQRSITNSDLEGYRRTRIESELAYEKRRKELGLPGADQRRRDFAALEERTREQLLSMRANDESAEQYWRHRASSLRSEAATTQAQIDYVRRRLDELPQPNSLNAFSTLNPFGVSGPFMNFPFPNLGLGVDQRISPFGNNRGRYNRYRNRNRFPNLFGGPVFVQPYDSYDYGYERAELINQLDELQMRNATLNVRWRELEDEARRAGAYPGWLRP